LGNTLWSPGREGENEGEEKIEEPPIREREEGGGEGKKSTGDP